MNPIFSFLTEITLTLILSVLIVRYLRPFLRRILIDLCGTEDRANFWMVFSDILLVGLPMIIALSYQPEAKNSEDLFFEVAAKLSGNLGGFLFALVGVGLVVAFFAWVAARRPKLESK